MLTTSKKVARNDNLQIKPGDKICTKNCPKPQFSKFEKDIENSNIGKKNCPEECLIWWETITVVVVAEFSKTHDPQQ